MKKVLKGWLIDNSVTTDNKTDKILLLASAGSLTLDDVLEEMYKQDTGLRPETMRHSVTLYHRIVMDLILNGYSVNTGLFRAVPQLKGVVDGRRLEQGEVIPSTSLSRKTRLCARRSPRPWWRSSARSLTSCTSWRPKIVRRA